MKNKKNRLVLAGILILSLLTACVDQHASQEETSQTANTIKDPRIVATSMATVFIMEKLDLDLVAVPDTNLEQMPARYQDLPKIGMAMSPDMEKIAAIGPDYVFSPVSLISDLLPKYEAANVNYGFLNLNNVAGMYKSIEDLGKLFDREAEARELLDQYEKNLKDFEEKYDKGTKPKVLLLMGLPGSYVVATENSYVGSLVKMAGGQNVYQDQDDQFINVNTEDMLEKDPDIILRTAHALPDKVQEMFDKDFETNDIWKHFRAVKEKKVYDLDSNKFGMSAKFNYVQAMEDLGEIFYDQ